MRLLACVLILLPLLLAATTCGQTGDLYLPEEADQEQAAGTPRHAP